jgi:SUMO ligase MMS21 Smc5/6 complex component
MVEFQVLKKATRQAAKLKKPANLNQFEVNLASESSFCVFAFLATWRKSFE